MNKRLRIIDYIDATCRVKEAMVACADSIRLAEDDQLESFVGKLSSIRATLYEVEIMVQRHMEATK